MSKTRRIRVIRVCGKELDRLSREEGDSVPEGYSDKKAFSMQDENLSSGLASSMERCSKSDMT